MRYVSVLPQQKCSAMVLLSEWGLQLFEWPLYALSPSINTANYIYIYIYIYIYKRERERERERERLCFKHTDFFKTELRKSFRLRRRKKALTLQS